MQKKWTYYVAMLTLRKMQTGDLALGVKDEYVFQAEGEYTLKDGLGRLGEAGYELVAVHPEGVAHGGEAPSVFYPTYIYIFKRPKESEEETKP